jgi:1-acyl-sn-glycerol-3-phosphate acyltransferase
MLRWFSAYTRRHLRRHFHAVRLVRGTAAAASPPKKIPVILVMNHASWWDPLIGLELKNRFFSGRDAFAPIDAAMLAKYRFFRRLGFFGVPQHSVRGAFEFLRVAEELLRRPNVLLAVTPQGRFVDVRERPLNFASGIGHLAARVRAGVFLPVAVEYAFWEDRFPEVLVHFGSALAAAPASPREWTARLEQGLAETQDQLATLAQTRDPSGFEIILHGRSGAAAVYDGWRACKAWVRGETFSREYGRL